MSLYDKASLIMTPSGAKATKLYSHKPHNGNGDFTHDRNNGTATRVNKDGYIETVSADVPRLDYPLIDGVVQDCPALLLEPSRTNHVQYSEAISSWVNSGAPTRTTNIAISPDGTTTADGLQSTSTSSYQYIKEDITVTANSTYTASLFVKKVTSETAYMGIGLVFTGGTTDVGYGIIDAVNGTGYSADPRIPLTIKVDDYGDYWRFAFTGTDSGSNTSLSYSVYGTLSLNGTSIAVGAGSVRTIWGMQLEQSSYPTSYIPNDGTTATVTRNADVCDSAGTSAEFNDSEGVLYAEIAALDNDGSSRRIALSNGNNTNRIEILYTSSNDLITYLVVSGNTAQATNGSSAIATQFNKVAVKYKANDFAFWINGFEVLTDNSGSTPTGLSTLRFEQGDGGNDFYGKTKELATFKEALTDTELEALTSWDSFTEMATGQEYSIR